MICLAFLAIGLIVSTGLIAAAYALGRNHGINEVSRLLERRIANFGGTQE